MKLKRCPCGQVPEKICVHDSSAKWAHGTPNCCGAWIFEFRTEYRKDEIPELSAQAWNAMPRAKELED